MNGEKMTTKKANILSFNEQIKVFLALFFGWFLYMFCRKSFSSTMPQLTYNVGFTKDNLGTIASSFSLAYGISKFLGAIISDHVDPKIFFFSGLLLSGLATFIFPVGSSFVLYCSLVMFLQGMFQGAGWPAIAKMLKSWFSPSSVGLYWSLVSCAGGIAAALCPVLVAYVISVMEWYSVYYSVGIISITSSFIIYYTLQQSSKGISSSEGGFPSSKTNTKNSAEITYFDLLRNKDLWLATWIYFILYILKNAICDWGQLYFIQQLEYKQTSGQLCSST